MAHKIKSAFDMVENIEGKEENAVYQHFSTFPMTFSNTISLNVIKSHNYVIKD